MRHKTTRHTYRFRNWSEYNAALVKRGTLTLWVSEEVLAAWHEDARTSKRGAPRTYSDTGILCMAWVIDAASSEIIAAEVTTNDRSSGSLLPALLDLIEGEIVQVSGDGAYDTRACYQAIQAQGTGGNPASQDGVRVFGNMAILTLS